MTDSKPSGSQHAFQAEVAQLLDLVVHSLYTDKEIFIRELISNASDALEKLRYLTLTEKEILEPERALEIRIHADDAAGTFIIQDSGIGMTHDEAVVNLGTIAHSGSREFLKQVAEQKAGGAELIGQFGVGFYSAFMVASEVIVESRSWHPESAGIVWTSTGEGSYAIEEKPGLERGTKITLKLKDSEQEYAKAERIQRLIHRYSSFVAFPIFVNNEKTSTVQALWSKSPVEISEDQYTEFYRFVAGRADEPWYRLHFNADAPLSIHSILFVPGENIERFGMERAKPGVSLYCKKVLIQQHADKLLPEYLRFVQGVVDSEDLPLNISRESMQD
ncbi:molecular chaperone HtpG, partial [bacterium]